MDWSIAEAISNVGFPIAMCLLLFWRMERSDQRHAESYAALRESIDNNTAVLLKIEEE
ncbi:hypothetical protein [Muribaculum intestinale]|uniref:hypothetical protein n=1 Tax=Muribaculum intestinale TaxID=1796646 RepID=UPI0025B64D37|nr:hypothetical protein [Muribaculum intestinale]